jgi:hypothetical protein
MKVFLLLALLPIAASAQTAGYTFSTIPWEGHTLKGGGGAIELALLLSVKGILGGRRREGRRDCEKA